MSVGGTNATYDANGDITFDTVRNFTWDAFGNASTISTPGGSTSITYDAFDRMVEQNNSGSYKQFIYSPTGFKMQIMNGSTTLTNFVPLPGGASIVYISSGYYFRHADWLGSSRFSSTSARAMYSDKAYAPFGEPYAQAGATTDLNFTGMNSDTSSGLYDFLYREYSTQGRWSQPDPAGLAAVSASNPQSWNRYAYVFNSPLNFVDPSGLCGNQWTQTYKTDPDTGEQVMATGPSDDSPCQSLQPWLTLTSFACWFSGACSPFGNSFGYPNSGTSGGGGAGPTTNSGGKIFRRIVSAACSLQSDVQTLGVGGDIGFLGSEGAQLGIAANGNSGQLGITLTFNQDAGFIGLDAYVYTGSVPNASDNSTLGGGFSSITNFTNHVNAGVGRIGGTYGITDKSRTFTFGPSIFLGTLSFGTSRTGVLNIPYAGYALNPTKAICKAVGS